ncbi:metal-sensing transcriptional repressor [endosymbiont 'TC1' of Trimyema compressum]|nr:metal-sensing transcriptional repressor [endosymbiont 'TC1' of Trimyema compressum]
MATEAILRKTNKLIIESHLSGCVKEAFETGNEQEKI